MALQMQRLDEAERLASAVLKADRGNLLAAQILGRALLAQGRAAEAVEPLQRAAKRSSDAEVETLLAIVLAAAGEDEKALDQLRATTARRPPFLPAFAELAGQLGKAGLFDEGIAVAEGALALEPRSLDLRISLGSLHIKRNNRNAARTMLSEVVAAAPERRDAMSALAQVMALDGEYKAAAELYRRMLALQPDDAPTRINLGKCLLELGERDAGEAALRMAGRVAMPMAGRAITALAAAPHGRFFLQPSKAAKFIRGDNG